MNLPALTQVLIDSLQLEIPPVGIAFTDSVPAGVPAFEGSAAAGCRFWQEATQRVFATVAANHELCAIGVYTHHLESTPAGQADLQDAMKVFADLGYVRPEDMAFIPVLNRGAKVVVYGPLKSMPVLPDLVMLFVKAEQTLVLSEASQQMENGLPPAMGRPACAIVPQAFNTGRTALSLGCCGARVYNDLLTPEVALYAIPASKLEAFSERVASLARANSILTKFHTIRRKDVESGKRPSVQESLEAMQ